MSIRVDPLFAKQWHFKLLGDIRTIWSEYSGRGVMVGVFDDGLQFSHPDLNDNYNRSLHLKLGGTTYNPDPITKTGSEPDAHGTAVAGLIAAERNGKDGMGVAWGAKLTGVNLLMDERLQTVDPQSLLGWGRKFDVMNNSWGYDPDYTALINRGADVVAAEIAGFRTAAEDGRGGLGTVVVIAAGNDGANANGDPLTSLFEVLSIAAIDRNGVATSYSNHGASIIVAAPAASVTTDLTGSNGYNATGGKKGNVTNDFSGTSASAPVVSGVAALMLEAAPELGWRDVREIIATSARMTGSVRGESDQSEVALPRYQKILTPVEIWTGTLGTMAGASIRAITAMGASMPMRPSGWPKCGHFLTPWRGHRPMS